MKIKIQLLTICLSSLFFIQSSFSANIYLYNDKDCMDRMVYSNAANEDVDYIVYRIQISAVEYIYLEIGVENQTNREFLPSPAYSCGNSAVNAQLVDAINNGRDRVFIVQKLANNRFGMQQVSQAAYFQHIGQSVKYNSKRYNFDLNTATGIIGENLLRGQTSNSQLYFEGRVDIDCSGALLMRIIKQGEAQPYKEIELIPEIGLSEERMGKDVNDAFKNVLRLEKIRNYEPLEYLNLICQGQPITKKDELTGKDIPKDFDQTPKTPNSTAKTATNPCGQVSIPGYHFVQKGETLYRISKMYNVTVSQIQDWNSLGKSTNIRVCDKLKIVDNLTQKGATDAITKNDPVVNVPPPYEDATLIAKSVAAREKAWETTSGYYVAKPGETVASVALKFGLTEARFRSINGLKENEAIKVGQPLITTDCPPNFKSNASNNTNTFTLQPKTPNSFDQIPSSQLTAKTPYDYTNDERITPQFFMQSEVPKEFQSGNTMLSNDLARRTTNNYISTTQDETTPQGYEAASTIKRATHVVKEGETLYRIARMYDISLDRLRFLNNLRENEAILPNQRLYIN
ncbi:MAG: LysM peptidoglycan-binding domain-containing protein [Saprospiraceae bacterium]|nr:LysM peptidoglycan-binding domain-containing protein [Saprospiraceae bacterium]